MARIAGVNIPTNKRVIIALQYIHGIGPKVAASIVQKTNIEESRRVNELSDAEVLQIREVIDRDYLVEGDLRRETSMNIKRLMDLGSLTSQGKRLVKDTVDSYEELGLCKVKQVQVPNPRSFYAGFFLGLTVAMLGILITYIF